MARYLFNLPDVQPSQKVRVDTASGSDSPATGLTTATGDAISSTLTGNHGGELPEILGPDGVTTLYLKTLTYSGAVTGFPVTVAGYNQTPVLPGNAAYAKALTRSIWTPQAPKPIVTMATPPTLTIETTNGIAGNRQVNAVPGSPFMSLFAGGGFTNQAGANGYTAAYREPIGFNRDPFSVELIHDGTDMSFRVTSAPGNYYRIWVDDQLATAWEVAGVGGGAIRYLRLTFASVAERKIRLDMVGGDIWAVLCGGSDTIRATKPRGPRVIVIADSYAGGAGTPTAGFSGIGSWTSVLSNALGWDDVWNGGIGGTGWITRNSSQTNNFQDRVAAMAAFAPDVVIWQGGKNDFGSGAAAVGAAAGATLTAARALLPNALFVVTGPVAPGAPTDGTSDPTWAPFQSAIFSAVAGLADITVDTTTAPIFTGTGKAGATTGVGNGDVTIQADAVHPTPRGQQLLGYALAHGLAGGLVKAPR